MKMNWGTLIVLLVAGAYLVLAYRDEPWTPMRVAGAIVGIVFGILVVVARVQLGRSFTVRAQAHSLVTSGIYSRVRNPIYVFGTLTLVGLALFIGKPWLLLGLVVIVPMQILRARREEQVLMDAFGEEYRRYKARTWF
jgi:protein-S-isoprenylcysteine O-methyltransferase Ste14